ncbi:hypothetical protein IAT38_005131 [Cryptococcus sp. DSM 104549]
MAFGLLGLAALSAATAIPTSTGEINLYNATLHGRDDPPPPPPLWGPDGPKHKDCLRKSWNSSWFTSALRVLAKLNPRAITKNVVGLGDNLSTWGVGQDKATFMLMNKDMEWKEFEIKQADVSDKVDNSHEVWWPGGFEMAAIELGGYDGLKDDSIDAGNPASGLQMLTGRAAEMTSSLYENQLWAKLVKSDTTPIIVSTGPNPDSPLTKNHHYVVMSTTGEEWTDGHVSLLDPDDYDPVDYKFTDLFDDVRYVSYIKDLNAVG